MVARYRPGALEPDLVYCLGRQMRMLIPMDFMSLMEYCAASAACIRHQDSSPVAYETSYVATSTVLAAACCIALLSIAHS